MKTLIKTTITLTIGIAIGRLSKVKKVPVATVNVDTKDLIKKIRNLADEQSN